jgi:hypothetical protein
MQGGTGVDTYVYAKGDGHDRITNKGDKDTIVLVGIDPGEVKVQRDESSFRLLLPETAESIIFVDGYASDAARLDRVKFDDGTIWSYDDLVAQAEMVAGSDRPRLHATNDATWRKAA